MEDILVFATPFEASEDNWGYMWTGFCEGKRFVVQEYEGAEDYCDVENGRYFFSSDDGRDRIPARVKKVMWTTPLASPLFMSGDFRWISIEAMMQIVEKGYDVTKAERNREMYYIDGTPIVEILPGGIISWISSDERIKKVRPDEVIFEMDEYGDRRKIEFVNNRDERFLFPVYLDSRIKDIDVDEAEMSVRATNCLKRAGFRNFGELLKRTESREDLRKIRNVSSHTAHEILKTLLCCQFSVLGLKEQKEYVSRILELNGKEIKE